MAANREMQWAIGAVAAAVLVVGVGGAAAAGVFSGEPTPTPSPVPPTPSPSPTMTNSPTPNPSPSPTISVTTTPSSTATQTPRPPTMTPTPVPTATPSPSPTVNVRRMTSAELQLLLRAEVEAQRAQFTEGKARFVPPDQVVITGRSTVGGQSVAVETFLTVGVDPNGRAKILASRVTQGGQPGAPELQAALAARVTQTNSELDRQIPRNQRVKRVWTTQDAIFGELAE